MTRRSRYSSPAGSALAAGCCADTDSLTAPATPRLPELRCRIHPVGSHPVGSAERCRDRLARTAGHRHQAHDLHGRRLRRPGQNAENIRSRAEVPPTRGPEVLPGKALPGTPSGPGIDTSAVSDCPGTDSAIRRSSGLTFPPRLAAAERGDPTTPGSWRSSATRCPTRGRSSARPLMTRPSTPTPRSGSTRCPHPMSRPAASSCGHWPATRSAVRSNATSASCWPSRTVTGWLLLRHRPSTRGSTASSSARVARCSTRARNCATAEHRSSMESG